MASYDDYRNSAQIEITAQGKRVTREVYIWATSEIEAQYHPDCPQLNEPLDVGFGSVSQYVYCSQISISQIENSGKSGQFLFAVVATYSPITRERPVPNKATWRVSFRPTQITLRNVKTTSHQTRYGPTPNNYPQVKTGINVTEEGPQGVSVDEMTEVLSIEFYKPEASATSFIGTVRGLVNKVNSSTFSGPWGDYYAGEARITGLDVSRGGNNIITVSVEISRIKNETVAVYLDTTGGTVNITKKGWEYLWVRFLRAFHTDESDIRQQAIDAYVAKIYEEADFSGLGIESGIWI